MDADVGLARSAAVALGLRLWSALEQPGPTDAACVRFWAEARYVAGYDHIVFVANGCDDEASCVVWTDVNPSPQFAAIAPHQTVAIVTFRGSPASAFTPFVRCAR
jgi:hypothetical protein